MNKTIEREIADIRVNLNEQLALLGALERQLETGDSDPKIRESKIVSEISDNLNDSDTLTVLEIAYQSIKWPIGRDKIGDLLDLSDQYLETLSGVLSGILGDKVESL